MRRGRSGEEIMNRLFLAMTALTAIAAAPAAAQYGRPDVNSGDSRFDERFDQLEDRIEAGIRSGEIDRSEGRSLRRQLRQLERTEDLYSRDGLDQRERAHLRTQMQNLRQEIRLADGGRGDRYDQWGSSDWNDNGYYGQGGPVEGNGWVVDETGGRAEGVPGLIGSFLGIGGLQVGQRVSGNLYAVPYEYRDQFRDSSNVYFRSDGRRIYEIDARTQTVLRVYNREVD